MEKGFNGLLKSVIKQISYEIEKVTWKLNSNDRCAVRVRSLIKNIVEGI